MTRTGKWRTGNPFAPFEVAGAGDGLTANLHGHEAGDGGYSQGEPTGHRASPRPYYARWGSGRPASSAPASRAGHPVVVWVGDQSFIHAGLSLATATEYGVAGVVIGLNNKTVQAEVEGARARFGRTMGDHYRIEATGEPWNPDIGMLARAMRAQAFRVEKPSEFKPALHAALASRWLCVLDVDCAADVPRYAVPLIRTLGTMPFPYPAPFEELKLKGP